MAKHLQIGDGTKWTLPDDADLEALRTRLTGAMNDGLAAVVDVVAGTGSAELLVNGKAVTTILLWEDGGTAGHKPTFTMID